MIRAVIVDDMATIRFALRRLLAADGQIEVVAEGRNGEEAVELTAQHRPDIVLLDVDMPKQDGLAATREIMATCATPILIVTSSSVYDARHLPFAALEAGALDVFPKPSISSALGWDAVAAKLCKTVRMLARVHVVTRKPKGVTPPREGTDLRVRPERISDIAVIGASTGGPAAILRILEQLPGDCCVPIAIVQHIGAEFVPGLVQWLDQSTQLHVSLAQDGQRLTPGHVVVAPGDVHIRLVEGPAIRIDHGPPVNHCRPAVDVLFHSAAQVFGAHAVAILLTGMGRDGAEGLGAVKTAGGVTIAQDKGSAVVNGMPGAAVELGYALHVLAPHAIGCWLARLATTGRAPVSANASRGDTPG